MQISLPRAITFVGRIGDGGVEPTVVFDDDRARQPISTEMRVCVFTARFPSYAAYIRKVYTLHTRRRRRTIYIYFGCAIRARIINGQP